MNDEIKETLEYKIDFLTKSLNIGIPTKNRRYFNDIKDYITNLQQKYDKALECLSSFNFEIPCENDEFFDEHCEWCDENCSVDEEQYKKCWNKFIEWKLGDRKDG